MWILCLEEDSLETSSLIFSENNEKMFMNVVSSSRDCRFKGYNTLLDRKYLRRKKCQLNKQSDRDYEKEMNKYL